MAVGNLYVVHPRDNLQPLVGSIKVHLNVEMMEFGAECPKFQCTVTIYEAKLVEAQECVTKEEAYVEGAQAAVKFLRSE